MTLYRGLFYKDKEREKSGPTKICRYSEFDVIQSVVIEGFDCIVGSKVLLPVWSKRFKMAAENWFFAYTVKPLYNDTPYNVKFAITTVFRRPAFLSLFFFVKKTSV